MRRGGCQRMRMRRRRGAHARRCCMRPLRRASPNPNPNPKLLNPSPCPRPNPNLNPNQARQFAPLYLCRILVRSEAFATAFPDGEAFQGGPSQGALTLTLTLTPTPTLTLTLTPTLTPTLTLTLTLTRWPLSGRPGSAAVGRAGRRRARSDSNR